MKTNGRTGRLAGKVAVVTGASKGIGASIAKHMAEAGASVVVNYSSDAAGAQRVVAAIAASGGTAVAASEFRTHVESQTPLGRIGQPRDIAPVVAFLASDEAGWITGESLYVSGAQA
jgi:NAD(P)-dependent dehydrogenase (short-subunit alcohol dehydrogenase family)